MSDTSSPGQRPARFTPPAGGRLPTARVAQPNGWWGMALFLCSEVTLFGTLLGTYFYLDFDARRWPPAGVPAPSVVLPFVAAAVLVSMSAPMWLAARAARRGERGRVIALIAFALLVQGCYLALQILLLRHDYNDFTPQGSAYGSIYFTVLVVHHVHVLLGILLDVSVLSFVTVRGLTDYQLIGVRGLALYWHVINVLAVIVVFTQLSPTL